MKIIILFLSVSLTIHFRYISVFFNHNHQVNSSVVFRNNFTFKRRKKLLVAPSFGYVSRPITSSLLQHFVICRLLFSIFVDMNSFDTRKAIFNKLTSHDIQIAQQHQQNWSLLRRRGLNRELCTTK